MAEFDCLLIGHNELDFEEYYGILENMASSGGREHVAFTDLQLNHVKYEGRPYQALDLLTEMYNEGRDPGEQREFYNGDCLWTAIAYLGSYLFNRGYTFDFINLFQQEKEELKRKLAENNYRLIVLTGTMYVFEQNIWEVITFIRRHSPDARIIAGGPYISKQAEEREPEHMKPLFRYLNADIYCYVREGEQTLVALLNALRKGEDISSIPNLAYKNGRDYEITPKKREVNPLSDIMIDYPMFADSYRRTRWANVRISDGCPYACGFCAFPEHGNERYLLMTLDRIEREFESIRESGAIDHVFFIDATLNVPRRQFKKMLEMMIRNQYGFDWHCFFRCDQTDEETIWLMKEAGCKGVFLGLESANETVLNNMDKTAHKEDFYRTMPWFKAAGLRQMISVLVGFPGETIESFRESLEFIEEIEPDFTRIQTWYCDPTTPVWFKREQFGLQGKGYSWKHDTMDSETAVELVVDSFFSLRNVSWIPDPGYNWTATYLMETLGMTVDHQKTFLEFFAATAKARLLERRNGEHDPALLDALRDCCHFDQGREPDRGAIEQFASDRYRAARAFWVEQFRGVPPRSMGEASLAGEFDYEASTGEATAAARWSSRLDRSLHGGNGGSAWVDDLLVTYRWVLARTEDLEGAMLIALDGDVTFPLRLPELEVTSPLASYAPETRQLVKESRLHHRFGWFVLTHGLTAKEFGVGCPRMKAAFLADGLGSDEASLRRRWRGHAAIEEEIDILLSLHEDEGASGVRVEIISPTGRFDEDRLSALGEETLMAMGVLPRVEEKADSDRVPARAGGTL
jgi:anaerobic magnesium-protoporphyrin IX monomethyl ester cyclase